MLELVKVDTPTFLVVGLIMAVIPCSKLALNFFNRV